MKSIRVQPAFHELFGEETTLIELLLIFIAIHIQPLIFALLSGGSALVCAAVWVYTILSIYGVNALAKHPAQKPAAAALVLLGLTGLLLASKGLAVWMTSTLGLYQLKLIFSFAVDHYSPAPSAG